MRSSAPDKFNLITTCVAFSKTETRGGTKKLGDQCMLNPKLISTNIKRLDREQWYDNVPSCRIHPRKDNNNLEFKESISSIRIQRSYNWNTRRLQIKNGHKFKSIMISQGINHLDSVLSITSKGSYVISESLFLYLVHSSIYSWPIRHSRSLSRADPWLGFSAPTTTPRLVGPRSLLAYLASAYRRGSHSSTISWHI